MSLELAIKENTEAVRLLTELMTKITSGAVVVATNTAEILDAEIAKATKASTTPKAETKPAKTEAAPAQVKSEAAAVTYEDVKKAILAFQQANGREATLATLKAFGAARGTDLKPEQYAEALATLTA